MYFGIGNGIHQRDLDNVEKNDGYAYYEKHIVSKNLGCRAWGGNLGSGVALKLFDPKIIKEYTKVQEKYYRKAKIYDLIRILGSKGLVFSEGALWKRHRKVVSSAFHFEFLKEMIPHMVEATMDYFKQLQKKNLTNIRNDFEYISGDVVGKVFFGEEFSQLQIDGMPLSLFLKELTMEAWGVTFSWPNLVLGSKFVKAKIMPRHRELLKQSYKFADFCFKKVQERRQAFLDNKRTDSKCLLDLLVRNNIENPEEGFDIEEIVHEFATFCIAGMDTTGHTLAMCSYYYLQNPQCKEKLLKEIDEYLSDSQSITIDSVNKMEYMHAFIQETLRLGTPTFRTFLREALEDHKLDDITVKKGTFVCFSFFPNNYGEEYHDEPLKFDPKRWLDANSKTRQSIAKEAFTFIPFSAGSRNCIGQHLALIETKIVFGLFLKHFEYHLNPGYKLRMTIRFLYEPEMDIVYSIQKKSQKK